MDRGPLPPIRALLTAAAIALAVPAFAQTTKIDPEVEKHFVLGNDLYNEGRYDDALVEYEKAYSLSKYWKILYNRGQVLVMLRREPEAIEDFERYLAEGGKEIPEERRKEVETDLEKLRRRLAFVILDGAPSGLEVLVDGRAVTKTPLAKPLVIGAGKHVIALRRAGKIVFTKDLQIAAGESSKVAVEIAPESKESETFPAKLPEEDGGLVHPAFPVAVALGVAAPLRNVVHGRINLLGALDASAAWRPHPLWSIGFFLGGAAGNVELSQSEPGIDSKANYSYGMGGVRARLHVLRDRYFDGWIGLDFGVWRETWKFTPTEAESQKGPFEWAATSPAFGLAGGLDFPLSRHWALGGAFRVFGTFVNSGDRVGCTVPGDTRCSASTLPGGGGEGGRGFFETTARLTYSFSYGAR